MDQPLFHRIGPWAAALLAATAFAMSVYLWYASATAEPVVGCDWSEFDCDTALASHWAKWLGVPVAAGGAAAYLAALVGAVLVAIGPASASAWGWRLLEGVTPLVAGAAIWFFGVQTVALDSFCVYCVATHLCGLVVAGLVVAIRLTSADGEQPGPSMGAIGLSVQAQPDHPAGSVAGPPELGLPTAAGVLALVALIGGQALGPRPAPVQAEYDANSLVDVLDFNDGLSTRVADSEAVATTRRKPVDPAARDTSLKRPKPRRREGGERIVRILNGSLSIDTYKHPVIGSPDAEHVVVELMDYACPHCREFHELIGDAMERFDGRVAVVVMPVPGELLCNPFVKKSRPKARGACDIAKVSLASSIVAPESFPVIHEWLLEGDRLPPYTSAIVEAQKHAGEKRFRKAVRDESGEIKARIEQYVKLLASLQKAGRVGLPTQLFPSRVVSGPPKSLDSLCELWAEEFGLEEPDSGPLPF